MRSGKEWASPMHLMDPDEPDGRHVIGRNDVTLGVVTGTYAGIRGGYPQWAAIQSELFGTDVSTFPGPRSFRPSGRTIVTLRDNLDFAAAPALRERLLDVLHRGIDLLILDLSHVESCDAVGLAVLVATQRRAGLLGITMRLFAPSLPVSMVLGSTGLKRHFAICSELSGARATEQPEPAGLASAAATQCR